MDTIENIMSRRSIRKFTGEVITESELKTILECGFQAPSAHNYQPRDYLVIQNKELLKEIESFHTYGKMITSAGTAILVCGDLDIQANLGFLISDCSAAIQNMLLASHELGLGAVWCGVYNDEYLVNKTRETLELPKNILPVGIVVVGRTEITPRIRYRYNEEKVHRDGWSK